MEPLFTCQVKSNNNIKYLIPPDEFHEALPVVDGADLAAEDPVQDLADGEGEGAGQQHEQLRQPDRVGAHGQPVPRADRLGDKAVNEPSRSFVVPYLFLILNCGSVCRRFQQGEGLNSGLLLALWNFVNVR